MDFLDKVRRLHAESDLVLLLRPEVMKMPLPIRRYDDPFLPFGKAIIKQTRNVVCGYMFDLAAYLAIGAAGAIALERTLSYIAGEKLAIIHGAFASAAFATISDENAFAADAVTLAPGADVGAYIQRADRGALTITSNHIVDYRYDITANTLTLTDVTLRVIGDDVVYADSSDDFAQAIRSQLEALR
jgi:hypothetical protein